jgi:hypothetical protein
MANVATTLTNVWQKVFDGTKSNCVLQVDGTCWMSIQPTADADPDGTTPGIKLSASGSGHQFASGNMSSTEVWLKEVSGDSSVIAVVAAW